LSVEQDLYSAVGVKLGFSVVFGLLFFSVGIWLFMYRGRAAFVMASMAAAAAGFTSCGSDILDMLAGPDDTEQVYKY
jgi:hypothetical protein